MMKGMPMHARKLAVLVAAIAALLGATPAHAENHSPSTVCNVAENSPRGAFVVTSDDPSLPPRDGFQMTVGNNDSRGLHNAAEHSPALADCVPDTGGGGGPF
jgi:hypothetical protein